MTFHDLKHRDETWGECAKRLGTDARFEGKSRSANPFPQPGFLRKVWDDAWKYIDFMLIRLSRTNAETY
jgi:hypothetical protein